MVLEIGTEDKRAAGNIQARNLVAQEIERGAGRLNRTGAGDGWWRGDGERAGAEKQLSGADHVDRARKKAATINIERAVFNINEAVGGVVERRGEIDRERLIE